MSIIKNKISIHLIIVINLIIIITGISSFGVYYFLSVKKMKNDFKEGVEKETEYLASTLSQNIWDIDHNAISNILEVINNQSDVVSINLEAGDISFNLSEEKKENKKFNILIKKDIIVDEKLSGVKGKKIGSLNVVYTFKNIAQNNQDKFISMLIILLLIILVISISLQITLNKFLKKPFDIFANGFEKIAHGDYEYVISMENELDIKGEFKPLLKSLSKMSNEIQIQMKQRESAEEKLIEAGNALEVKVVERTKSLKKAQTQLLKSSRQAGMAEVATNVIHNVGNALNSINVSSEINYNKLRGLRLSVLKKVVDLFEENKENTAEFIANDAKGKMIPEIINEFLTYLTIKRDELVKETENVKDDIGHVQNIINMQQSYAKNILIEELQSPSKVLEDAIRMNRNALKRHNIEIVVEADELPMIKFDMHKVLQILINLISNAKHSYFNTEREKNLISCSIKIIDDKSIEFKIKDNGCGIKQENMEQIYNYGFTTRKDGHGFGLHNSSNTAKQLGGELSVSSDGEGKGAEFTLKVPISKK